MPVSGIAASSQLIAGAFIGAGVWSAGAFIGAGVWSTGAFIGAGVWNCFSAIVCEVLGSSAEPRTIAKPAAHQARAGTIQVQQCIF